MKKGSIMRDAFEEVVEFGKSTVKSSASAGKSIAGGALDQLLGHETGEGVLAHEGEKSAKGSEKKDNFTPIGSGFTPLDTQKIEGWYKKQDYTSIEALRRQFHDMVRREEKQVLEGKKRETYEKIQQEERQMSTLKKSEEQKKKEAPVTAPKGKERKSILSPKKKIERSTIERRVGSGKQ